MGEKKITSHDATFPFDYIRGFYFILSVLENSMKDRLPVMPDVSVKQRSFKATFISRD